MPLTGNRHGRHAFRYQPFTELRKTNMPISHPEQARSQLGLRAQGAGAPESGQGRDVRARPYRTERDGQSWPAAIGAMVTAVALVVLVIWLATV
jgi:hypothetical protein